MLPPETERVWRFLKQQPALKGFVLVGGSALALRNQLEVDSAAKAASRLRSRGSE